MYFSMGDNVSNVDCVSVFVCFNLQVSKSTVWSQLYKSHFYERAGAQ